MSIAEHRAVIESQDEALGYKTSPTEASSPRDDSSHKANGHMENGPVPEPQPEDSTTTRAELLTRRAQQIDASEDEPPAKKARTDDRDETSERSKGIALIKPEFRSSHPNGRSETRVVDDDAAERADKGQSQDSRDRPRKDKKKNRGQNKARDFGSSQDEKGLCSTRSLYPEFSPKECQYGEKCKFEHDLRRYLRDWKRADLDTFDGKCPIFAAKGWCFVGWKCRYIGSHSTERELDDGRKELVLLGNPLVTTDEDNGDGRDIVNAPHFDKRNALMRKTFPLPKSDVYTKWLADNMENDKLENRALYRDAPLLPSEKRKVYFGPETPLLAPLTTQGNLPFRRLAVQLGAQLTYSEMAMGLPLIKGQKSEWALMRAHQTELSPPSFSSKGHVVQGYDNSKDLRFGAQIAGNQPWLAMKTTETLTSLCSHLRVIDLNCGCPIDLVCDQGAGSQLLENPGRLEKILRGMNTVSGEVPITVKIRMGTKDSKPTAIRLVDRLVYGTEQAQAVNDIPSGIAAITLHGRSKQQRYTKLANWQYIGECAALIKRHRIHGDSIADTVREADPRDQANEGHVYFNGNGDCYSHIDYYDHLEHSGVDSVMIGRGALIKPWLFEEIQTGQYLDKSSKERLEHIEQFCRYGMEVWGSDEQGIGTTRRFLLEWLNFTHRYVPIGLLEHLPPNIQERAQPWRGRDDMETLLGSENYLDWIKISEIFLGPAHKDFRFQPKHKSNSYEAEG